MVAKVDESNFQTEVLEAKGKVLIDLYADWCGPCKMMAPVIEQLSEEQTDVKCVKLNVDQAMSVAQQYRVVSIPTFLFFKDGELKERVIGAVAKEELQAVLDRI